jgi:site-specific recombinase XerD
VRIARELLVITQELDLSFGAPIALEQVNAGADRWAHRQRRRRRTHTLRWSRILFLQVAVDWFRFLGRFQDPETQQIPFAPLMEDFAAFMGGERGLSTATIRNYQWQIRQFLDWFSSYSRPFAKVSVVDVDAFLAKKGQRWSRVSVATSVKALRAFFVHAEQQGWCVAGIAAAIESPRIFRHETLPAGPTWEDLRRLIPPADSHRPRDIRDRAILMLLSVYGLRSGEVAKLRLDDIDWAQERITVFRTKQWGSQVYPLTQEVGTAIVRYLKEVRPRCSRREVFLTLRAPFRPLSAGGLYYVTSSRFKQLGIHTPRRGPHALRHACASHLVAEGLSLKSIGDHLGHRSLSSTRLYAKVDLAGLREVAHFDLGGLI